MQQRCQRSVFCIKYSLSFIFLLLITSLPSAQAGMITQLTPTLTITEEYSDNFLKTETDTQEEWITSYELGFSMGFIEKRSQVYLAYNPEYIDYKNFDDRDSLDHNVTLSGSFQPSKRTTFDMDLGYDGHQGNNQGESWEHTASALLNHQITKHLNFSVNQDYSKTFDQQERTGVFKEHEVNSTTVSVVNESGEKDQIGVDFSYEFDDYKQADQDEYKEFNTSGFITYWMNPLNGIDSNISYKNRKLQNFNDDLEEYEGYFRYLRKFSKHLDGYVKYRHYLSQKDSGDHTIYHPSVGFDWDVTRDSGISMGTGVLFHDWEDGSTSTEPFFDVDVYKIYDFSRRGILTLRGASGYEDSTGEDIDKGFSTYYQTSFDLDYQLLKHLSSNINGSVRLDDFHGPSSQREDETITYETGIQLNYQLRERMFTNVFGTYTQNEYHETDQNRQDKTIELGGGVSWSPLKWIRFNLSYQYTEFVSDSSERGDSTENEVTFSVSFIPKRPITIDRIKIKRIGESGPTEEK
ncbi:outer membrane beta-barrel protein [Desulfospira joergensenii]|uniref:outer membrane beta-barrel protein n=1 Tax=Desulfospira joergensenii TaxID=53329 RepID=UPI0003B4C68D|nr:outer membrane beta-barrel protein [Desulfospira joergensenii]